MVVVTEVVQLGEEQIIITRIVELEPTPVATQTPRPLEPQPVAIDLGYLEELPNLDPQFASDRAGLDLAENLFVGLTKFNHEGGTIEPELAQEWRVSGDGLTWTFELGDDHYWVHPLEGQIDENAPPAPEILRPVDAYDVVFAIRRACQRSSGVPDAFNLFIIQGCEAVYQQAEPTEEDLAEIKATAVDNFTVEIQLNEPASYFLTLTALPPMRPVPRELVAAEGDKWVNSAGEFDTGWQTPGKLVTSGPFVPVLSSLSLTGATLFRNPLWPEERTGNADLVAITYGEDEMSLFESWQAKEVDLSILPAAQRELVLDESPNKARLVTNQDMFYVGFNFDSPVFQQPELRRAFATAVNREELIETLFERRGLGMRHFTPPGVIGAPRPDEVGVGYSPDFALRQMDQSGAGSCKLLPPMTFLVSTADLSLLQAELLRDMWIAELGCAEETIQIEQVPFGELLNRTAAESTQRPDLWELAWPPHYPDANAVLSDLFHCTDGENRQNRPCDDADRSMRQARIAPQIADRVELYREAENVFFSENGSFPVIPLYVRGDYLLAQNWMVDFTPVASGGQPFDTIWIDQELKRLEKDRG